jgi:hypothetical protein
MFSTSFYKFNLGNLYTYLIFWDYLLQHKPQILLILVGILSTKEKYRPTLWNLEQIHTMCSLIYLPKVIEQIHYSFAFSRQWISCGVISNHIGMWQKYLRWERTQEHHENPQISFDWMLYICMDNHHHLIGYYIY